MMHAALILGKANHLPSTPHETLNAAPRNPHLAFHINHFQAASQEELQANNSSSTELYIQMNVATTTTTIIHKPPPSPVQLTMQVEHRNNIRIHRTKTHACGV